MPQKFRRRRLEPKQQHQCHYRRDSGEDGGLTCEHSIEIEATQRDDGGYENEHPPMQRAVEKRSRGMQRNTRCELVTAPQA
jgi:hypothetical protein